MALIPLIPPTMFSTFVEMRVHLLQKIADEYLDIPHNRLTMLRFLQQGSV
jgi:hypothetical protein